MLCTCVVRWIAIHILFAFIDVLHQTNIHFDVGKYQQMTNIF